MDMDKDAIIRGFNACLLTQQELAIGDHGEKMNAWKHFNDPFPEFTSEHLASEEVH
jgi:hypothetical protein